MDNVSWHRTGSDCRGTNHGACKLGTDFLGLELGSKGKQIGKYCMPLVDQALVRSCHSKQHQGSCAYLNL